MAELNIGALTDSSSYTGSLGTANIYDLYKFNITSPGSFKFAIDNLSGNADIFLLNNSGATLYSSTNAGNAAETINADSLVAGDYTLKVLQVTGDIKYTLNLAPTDTQKTSEADTLTGAKSDSPLDSNSATTAEKLTANKDVITGDAVDEKTVTAEAKTATTEDPVSTTSETTFKSEPEKTLTETASAIATSETTDKAFSSSSETTIKSEPENTETATASATSETTEKSVTTSAETTIKTEPKTPETAGETVASNEPKTSETVADVPDASKSEEKPNTATTNGEDKQTENANTAVPTAETTEKLEPTNKELAAANPFTTGVFVVDSTGKVSIDYILDGGLYRGQLAIISLKGMEKFVPGSPEFFKEAAARAMSNSEKGYIVIDDLSEGARFNGNLPEGNFNEGAYLGVKTFSMTPGDEFGIMMVPNDTVKFLYDYPSFGGDKRPLFSMVTANPNEAFHLGQIVDVTGEGNTFTMEDLRFDLGTDKDYNDIVFQIRGAKGKAALMDSVVNPNKDWRQTDLGKAVIAYAKPYITPEPENKPNLKEEVSDAIDELEKQILTPSTSEKETPKNPAPAATDKDTTDGTKVAPTDKVEEKPTTPTVTAEEKVKDTASNSGDAKEVETADKVETKPTDATTASTASKDPVADAPETSPVEKTPVSPVATEIEDKVTEAPATETLPGKSNVETQVTTTEKAETKPEVSPAESKVKEESKPVVVTEEKDKVTEAPAAEILPDKSTVKTEVAATTPTQKVEKTPEVLPAETSAQQETIQVVDRNAGAESQNKETVTETATVQEEVAKNNNVLTDDLVARLESIKQRLSNLSGADAVEENTIDRTSISRLETLTQKLQEQTRSNPISDNTAALISRLEDMVVQVAPKQVETIQFEFPKVAQPLVGIFNENGLTQGNPKIDYSQITLAKDRVENDANPLVSVGTGNNPDSAALAIIEQINKNAPLVVGRAPASSEEWAKSLIEYVDTAKASGQPNAIVSLNLNLTEVNKDGSITPRYELTKAEKDALAYAQKYNVLVVVPAGEEPETMSAIGDISLEFDNIMTVGAAKRVNNSVAASKAYDLANTSGSGYALDILADGSSGETFNTSVAANKVAGAASQVWAANPKLSYRQVVDIIHRTATDLNDPNWDFETGSGLLNIPAAVNLAKVMPAIDTDVPIVWLDFDKKNQPLIGIIDTGFNGKNPDIDYKRIILGRDRVDNDNDPLLGAEGSEHGTHVLGIIGATQGNGIGIDGMNDDASIWLGRAIGSGKWAESLREFVDAAKASGQPKAVVNLSFDLTQINPDGSVTTRYELTPQERQAIEYARQNGVMIVVAAGNNGGTMSALGQASQEFDNIITVGSINYNGDRADYSSFGYGLDFVARGGTPNNPVTSTVGDGVDLKTLLADNNNLSQEDDEMSAGLQNVFDEEFGEFYNSDEADLELPDDLTEDERQAYEEAIKAIDKTLATYEEQGLQKVGMEFIQDYLGVGIESADRFLNVFNEDAIDNLIKAEEILGDVLENGDASLKAALNFSSLSDLDVDEELLENDSAARLFGLDFPLNFDLDMGTAEMAGTSVAAAKVTGVVSQVWAANPNLSYVQVKEILKKTAVDIGKTGWDLETGAGLVNTAAAIDLARKTVPEAYQPQPIQSPTRWSGQDKVTPNERAVAVSVPQFTGRVMDAGYVTTVGFQRIRSGPGTGYDEVGRKYPGEAVTFDAYENNGGSYSDPYVTSSSRWYKIAGSNNWMWAGYLDNSPELAEQERQRQEAIRQAEEEARRAEEEARRAEEEARRAEEELRRLEEEARRQAEEEARLRAAQLQAAMAEWALKVGTLGTPLGSFINNGVAVYKFVQGNLLIQPDGNSAFYEIAKNTKSNIDFAKNFNKHIGEIYNKSKKIRMLVDSRGTQKLVIESSKKFDQLFTPYLQTKLFGKQLTVNNPLRVLNSIEFASKYPKAHQVLLNAKSVYQKNAVKGLLNSRKVLLGTKTGKFASGFAKGVTTLARNPILSTTGKLAGKATPFLNVGSMALGHILAKTDEEKKRSEVQMGASLLAGAIGTAVGTPAVGLLAMSTTSLLFDAGYFAADKLGFGDDIDKFFADSYSAVGNGINAVSSSVNDAIKAAREKAQAAKEKAQQAVEKAKATFQAAKTKVEQVTAAYNTFKQESQKAVTNLVQQSKQKVQADIQKAKQAIVQNAPRVVKQVAQYAKKAANTVSNVINGAKQFVGNIIDKGKQMIGNAIEKGKEAIQAVTTFVSNTYNSAKEVVANTYNSVANKVQEAKGAFSSAVNKLKFW